MANHQAVWQARHNYLFLFIMKQKTKNDLLIIPSTVGASVVCMYVLCVMKYKNAMIYASCP